MTTETAPRLGWTFHTFAVALVAVATGVLFLREPGSGDEVTYWNLAFDLHEIGGHAWSIKSFHDLRWPMWGSIWLWQSVFGPGLASFYGPAFAFLAAAAMLAFTFGRIVFRSLGAAWACALVLLLNPLIDTIISRPMPDIPEAVIGGGAVLAWWAMMNATAPRRAWFFGALAGVCIGVAYSNRVSGIFIAPMLAVATLVLFPRRWKWLLVPALFSALVFGAECAVYHHVCGDWLHNLHVNLTGRGSKDAEAMSVFHLPVRYLSTFWKGNRLAPIYCILAVGGLWSLWRKGGATGRLVVVWFGVIYFAYSCAVQSLHPVRPLIGSTARYLASMVIPMSVFVVAGAREVGRWLAALAWCRAPGAWFAASPVIAAVVGFAALALFTARSFFDLTFVMQMRRYMAALPDGTKIFSHHAMHDLACLVDGTAARRFVWDAPKAILIRSDDLEQRAAKADEFWFARKEVWLVQRKKIEGSQPDAQPDIGSYLVAPERDWLLTGVFARSRDASDSRDPNYICYRRRPANTAPTILPADTLSLPAFPIVWTSARDPKFLTGKLAIPAALRGKLVRLELQGASPTVEPLSIDATFTAAGRNRAEYWLRPIFFAAGGREFLHVAIPADADECRYEIRVEKNVKEARITALRLIVDPAEP